MNRCCLTDKSWYRGNVANFLVMACHLAMTLLPIYWLRIGFLDWQIGWLAASFSLSAIATRFFLGGWLERWGRKLFMISGPLVLTLVCFGFDSAGDHFWTWLGLRTIQGCGLALALTSMMTWVTDRSKPEELGQKQGLFGVSGLLGSAIGPIVAEQVVLRYGFSIMFLVIGSFGIVSAAFALSLPESGVKSVDKSISFMGLLRRSTLFPVFIVTVPFGWFAGTVMTFIGPLIERAGLTGLGIYFAGFAVAAIAVRVFAGSWIDAIPSRELVTRSSLLLVVSSTLFANLVNFPSMTLLVVGAVLNGLGHGFLFPGLILQTVKQLSETERGSGLAVFTGVFEAGILLGSVASGYVSQYLGIEYAFAASALLLASSLPLYRKSCHH